MPGFEDDDLSPRRAHQDDDRDDYDDGRRTGGRYKEHRGVMILVFGILGLMMCGGFGIAAWMMGKNDLREIEAGRMDPEGKALTNVGYILGIVGTILWGIYALFMTAYVAFIVIVIAAFGK